MTWDEVLETIRTGLRESGAHLRTCTKQLEVEVGSVEPRDKRAFLLSLATLSLAVSNLHNVISGLGLGMEAIVETLREASSPPDKP